MKNLIIAIDQSTSATKAMLFNERCEMLKRVNVTHEQYYPRTRWVEHDVEEIYRNVLKSIAELIEEETADNMYSLAITNQRETVVVWNKHTGKPLYNAVVWQCMRGADICNDLKNRGYRICGVNGTNWRIESHFSRQKTVVRCDQGRDFNH